MKGHEITQNHPSGQYPLGRIGPLTLAHALALWARESSYQLPQRDLATWSKPLGRCGLANNVVVQLKQSTVRQLYDEKKVTVLVMRHGNRVMLQPPDHEKIS